MNRTLGKWIVLQVNGNGSYIKEMGLTSREVDRRKKCIILFGCHLIMPAYVLSRNHASICFTTDGQPLCMVHVWQDTSF